MNNRFGIDTSVFRHCEKCNKRLSNYQKRFCSRRCAKPFWKERML